jgi:branched-chain amino acid transport system ATP-binding protein
MARSLNLNTPGRRTNVTDEEGTPTLEVPVVTPAQRQHRGLTPLRAFRSAGHHQTHLEPLHPDSILEVRDVDAGYGPIQILFGASLHVRPGERVALLGTNGAGKSTLLRAVSGLNKPSAGAIWFDGQLVSGRSPQDLVRMGAVYISGGRAVFPSLTVLENLKMSAYPVRRDRSEVSARLDEALELFPRLRERASQRAGTLSGGEQQMVAVGRALVARPKLLMIDELSLGLAPIMLLQLEEMVKVLADEKGMTMLIVEQSLNMAAKIADRAYFMEKGAARFEGDLSELLQRDDLVRSVFFGTQSNGTQTEEPQQLRFA